MTDERERMLQQIDRIEHNVAVIGGILCTAVSLALALVVGRELEAKYGVGPSLGAFVAISIGGSWLLQRRLK
jgi:hypothetical protein